VNELTESSTRRLFRLIRRHTSDRQEVFEVVRRGEKLLCERDGEKLPGCEGHEELPEAVAAHKELHLVEDLYETGYSVEIWSDEYADHEIVPFLSYVDDARVEVNGQEWWVDPSSDTLGVEVEPHWSTEIHGRAGAERDWLTSHWGNLDTGGTFMWGIAGDVTIDRLGDFYSLSDSETLEGFTFWMSEPETELGRYLPEGFLTPITHYVHGPILDSMSSSSVAKILGEVSWYLGEKPHVFWVDGELWELPSDLQPPRPYPSRRSDLPPAGEPVALEWGDRYEATWTRAALAGAVTDTEPANANGDSADYIVCLPAAEEGELDLETYELLLEAAFKRPGGTSGDQDPLRPASLSGGEDGPTGPCCRTCGEGVLSPRPLRAQCGHGMRTGWSPCWARASMLGLTSPMCARWTARRVRFWTSLSWRMRRRPDGEPLEVPARHPPDCANLRRGAPRHAR